MKAIATTCTNDSEQRLAPVDLVLDANFGVSVAVVDNRVVVGANRDGDGNTHAVESGSAYTFSFDGSQWAQEQKLTASDGIPKGRFGGAVSIEGDMVVVGAPGSLDDAGSAYVYRRDAAAWNEMQKLTAESGPGDYYGHRVEVEDSLLVVGEWSADLPHRNMGAIHVYRFDNATWDDGELVTASDMFDEYTFGKGIAISDGVIAVGSPGHIKRSLTHDDVGAAYLYKYEQQWIEQPVIFASDGTSYDYFGEDVALNTSAGREVLIVGAYNDRDNGAQAGSVYIYDLKGIVDVKEETLEGGLKVVGPFPNPVHQTTTLEIDLSLPSHLRVDVYDMIGRHVRTLADRVFETGRYEVEWYASSMPGGLYVFSVRKGDDVFTRSAVVIR